MRKPGEVIVGLGFLAIGIGFMVGAVKLQIGGPTDPQPGFFPFLDGIVLIVLSAIFLIQVWRGRIGESQAFGKLWAPVIVVVTMILYVAVIEKLGYIISTAILSAVVMKVLETKLWPLVIVSIVLPAASFVIFDRLLGITLPLGIMAAVF